MKIKKTYKRILTIVLVCIILLLPFPVMLNDGGSVYYCAVLYQVKILRITESIYDKETGESEIIYHDDVEFYIFPFNLIEYFKPGINIF